MAPARKAHHTAKTTERGLGWAWQKARRRALDRDLYLCRTCQAKGRVTPATEVDHITPRSKGGTDDLANLQAICGPCHRAKTAADEGHAPRVRFDRQGRVVW